VSATHARRSRRIWPMVAAAGGAAVLATAVLVGVGRGEPASQPPPGPTPSTSAPSGSVAPTVSVRPVQPAELTARLAWFYKPPQGDEDEEVVLSAFDTFVLARGDEDFKARVQAERPDVEVLQYFLLSQILEPEDGQPEQRNNAAYLPGDFAELLEAHPDWFLRDADGEPIVEGGKYYRMDPGSQGWRDFWLQRVLAANDGWDGLFIDNADLSLCGFQDQGIDVPAYPDDASYLAAVRTFLQQVRTAYHEATGKPIVANMVNECSDPGARRQLYPSVQGVMTERFAVGWGDDYLDPAEWSQQLARIRDEVRAGLQVVLVAQGEQGDEDRQRFAFASYLLVAAPDVSFRYAWARLDDGYREPWLYDDYDSRLGAPRGEAVEVDGVWRRTFENGTVTVDPQKRSARIVVSR